MGKTKTALVSAVSSENLSGKDKYLAKQKKKQEEEALLKQSITGVGLKGGERIKTVGAGPIIEDVDEVDKAEGKRKQKQPRGKNYKTARKKIDKTKTYKLPDALAMVRETSYAKFDATVELHLVSKKEKVSENIELPHSTGKSKKVEVANKKTIEKLKKGKADFDVLLSTPEMMRELVPFAKILGPRGLMPNPKNGTLIKDKKQAGKFSQNSVTIKTEKKQPVIHTTIGKLSQKDKELVDNVEKIIDRLGAKQIVKAYLTSSMSPSVKLQV